LSARCLALRRKNMLLELAIINIALVKNINIQFKSGLIALTGETGAGKSVIIGALNLVLGGKLNHNFLREGAEKGEISATFDLSSLDFVQKKLREMGVEIEDEILFLKREVLSNGKSRCFINGKLFPLNMLKSLGEELIDIHGQHDHQSLLKIEKHIDLLDTYGALVSLRDSYFILFKENKDLWKKKKKLLEGGEDKGSLIDFYSFQLKEIEDADIKEGELEELEQEFDILSKAESIKEVAASAYAVLYEEEQSAGSFISMVIKNMQGLGIEEDGFKNLLSQLEETLISLNDVSQNFAEYSDRIEVDPKRIAEVSERIELINGIKRKYKKDSVQDLLEFHRITQQKLKELLSLEEEFARLDKAIENNENKLDEVAKKLTLMRKKTGEKLAEDIKQELNYLGFKRIDFLVEIKEIPLGNKGKDRVEFLFSANLGESLKSLKEVASGGELSRVMLGIKVVLAEKDQIPVLVFDEIDANIGGRLGNVIGEKLKKVAKNRQVICITHLPQIASVAHNHFGISKNISNGRTYIQVQELKEENRIAELANMLGGKEYSKEALNHAEALLAQEG